MSKSIEIVSKGEIWDGLEVFHVKFRAMSGEPESKNIETRSAYGRGVFADLGKFEIRAYPFYDVINSSKSADVGVTHIGCCPESNINLGATVKDFVEGVRRESVPPKPDHPEGPHHRDMRRCVCASNALHTNFVRPNGFIIAEGKVIKKPEYALGLDCTGYRPLNCVHEAFVFGSDHIGIEDFGFCNGELKSRNGKPIEEDQAPVLAISGPALVRNCNNVSCKVKYRPRKCGPTKRNEVNYPPSTTMTSFSAIGVSKDGKVILISMFEGLRGMDRGVNLGVTIYDLAGILEKELDARDAILLGGGADTQQFVRGDFPQHMVAPVRARSPGQSDRPEVEGVRGLGAIIAVLAKGS